MGGSLGEGGGGRLPGRAEANSRNSDAVQELVVERICYMSSLPVRQRHRSREQVFAVLHIANQLSFNKDLITVNVKKKISQ